MVEYRPKSQARAHQEIVQVSDGPLGTFETNNETQQTGALISPKDQEPDSQGTVTDRTARKSEMKPIYKH